MNYATAHDLVSALIATWRKRTYPPVKAETVDCPACHGRLRLIQTSAYGQPSAVSAHCSGPFCVHYTE
jgi:hypothetical protein